ncbi:hypothetical protein RBSWK_06220 [Rhodopirellula baltica SWK14]|uniref:Uncharacterized protein n=1 Tax=Rhodopirellula baltica SWK14 TaxID=993516 RepID=L7C7N7_RHOBT|nr:hypothetical protein RBSWK_06220 [Rhodopirellula baltica SWK14]
MACATIKIEESDVDRPTNARRLSQTSASSPSVEPDAVSLRPRADIVDELPQNH